MKTCLLFFILLGSAPYNKTFAQKLIVAVSSNAQYALEELVSEFEKKNTIQINLIIGSSGRLTNQITHGAPFDIFFSADLGYPLQLKKRGFSIGEPEIYAYGTLILWTTHDIELSKDLDFLKSPFIKKIAVGNPTFSPYGKETIEIFKKSGIYEEIKLKLIQGESLSQVNQYIHTGVCDVGITSKSTVLAGNIKKKGNWLELDASTYSPIPQAAVILKRNNKESELLSKKFLDFVLSGKGKEILRENGYNFQK